jgi:hypothetical protein
MPFPLKPQDWCIGVAGRQGQDVLVAITQARLKPASWLF